jgi:RNA recognition motif-containing protein
MKAELFFTNIPYNCTDRELRDWIEARGIEAESIRIIRDMVSGASPAFAYAALKDYTQLEKAVSILNGKKMRTNTIVVKESRYRQARAGGR